VLFYQAVDLNMDTVNIGLDQPLSKLEEYATGRPSAVPSINPLSPLASDNEHFDLQSPTNTHFLHSELPTPDTVSPIPTPTHTPPISHPQPEEKKMRWGLGRKIKRDKK
jgi:hypothetical protein